MLDDVIFVFPTRPNEAQVKAFVDGATVLGLTAIPATTRSLLQSLGGAGDDSLNVAICGELVLRNRNLMVLITPRGAAAVRNPNLPAISIHQCAGLLLQALVQISEATPAGVTGEEWLAQVKELARSRLTVQAGTVGRTSDGGVRAVMADIKNTTIPGLEP